MIEMMNSFTNVVFLFKENLIFTLMVLVPIVLYLFVDLNKRKYGIYLIISIIIGALGLLAKAFNLL